MTEWRIFADKIHLMKHENADSLEIGKLQEFSLVIAKGQYQEGDIVVFAPSKSIIPEEIRNNYVSSNGTSYLTGKDHDRVQNCRLRGILSMGVSLNRDWVIQKLGISSIAEIPLNVDLSEQLDIKEYKPPIPAQLAGQVKPIEGLQYHKNHDVEQWHLYKNEFIPGEEVIFTEKIHSTQISVSKTKENKWIVSSKGFNKKDLCIEESENNFYWQAFYNSGIKNLIENLFPDEEIQFWGEATPVQAGFSYGFVKPDILVFRMTLNGRELSWDEMVKIFNDGSGKKYMVPLLYRGKLDEEKLLSLAKGMETVSGKQINLKEGGVVQPVIPRRANEGFWLQVKIINPKYKDNDEEIN